MLNLPINTMTKHVEITYEWLHKNSEDELEEVSPIYTNESYFCLETSHSSKESSITALLKFIDDTTQYSYNSFVLVETYRVIVS